MLKTLLSDDFPRSRILAVLLVLLREFLLPFASSSWVIQLVLLAFSPLVGWGLCCAKWALLLIAS